MVKTNYELFVESANIGNRLFLKCSESNLDLKEWAVEDKFNGKTRFYKINEEAYGFYIGGNYANLYLKDVNNNICIIKNVPIIERK